MSTTRRSSFERGTGRTALLLVALAAILAAGATSVHADDNQVRLRILNRLKGQVGLDTSDLQVSVRGGEVELTGSVASLGDLKKLDRLVYGVVGVELVTNNLGVRPSNRSDQAIEEQVRLELQRRPRFREHPVAVSVSGRVVTLSGDVERSLDRSDAAGIAEGVEGVVQVDNRIRVTSSQETTPDEIRSRCLAILANPLTFGVIQDLQVEVDGSTVTVRGVVRRQADKNEATRLLRQVPGVLEVNNRLDVRSS